MYSMLKNNAIIMFFIFFVYGCSSPPVQIHNTPTQNHSNNNIPIMKQRMINARDSANVVCDDYYKCKRAFMAAKNYVIDNSDMRVQVSDEYYISTYRPTTYNRGMIGLSARMVPYSNDSYRISIDGECAIEINECLNKLTVIFNGFKPSLESII